MAIIDIRGNGTLWFFRSTSCFINKVTAQLQAFKFWMDSGRRENRQAYQLLTMQQMTLTTNSQ